MRKPLSGFRVLDLTQSVAGPYCTMILGDLGADVVKVEHPDRGDDTRSWGPPYWGDESTTFLSLNRNKRSVALDLKRAEGQEILRELLQDADVLAHNLRPKVADRLGLGYESVKDENPKIIYCAMTAYGNAGPMQDFPGYDPLMQAFGGLMSITGEPDGSPVRVGTSIMDMGMGMWAVIGILGALHNRAHTGEGELVETSLYETALSWIPYQIMSYLGTNEVPHPRGSGTAMLAPYEAYPTSDGHLLVAAGNNSLWGRLCSVLQLEQVRDDPRFQDNPDRVRNREALFEVLAQRLRTDTTAAWAEKLWAAEVPCSPIRTVDQVVAEPQTEAVGILRSMAHPRLPEYKDVGLPVRWDKSRPETRRVPPRLGDATEAILDELGRSSQEINELVARGIVIAADHASHSTDAKE